jgi:hypothetical protein
MVALKVWSKPSRLAFGGFMENIQARLRFAPRALTLGALAAGATAIGLLAIGWISIEKLRVFARPLN